VEPTVGGGGKGQNRAFKLFEKVRSPAQRHVLGRGCAACPDCIVLRGHGRSARVRPSLIACGFWPARRRARSRSGARSAHERRG